MDLFFFIKLLIVTIFFVMFLRGSKVVWGIGLLTVTTAFLLDTIWSTFGREEILADVGFFFYVFAGGLFGGAAIWLWGLLRKVISAENAGAGHSAVPHSTAANSPASPSRPIELRILDASVAAQGDGVYADAQELFEQIRLRLGPQDVRDLIFDLQLNENDVLGPQQEMTQTVTRLVSLAQEQDKMGALALAVERILTPVSPESLPRRDKLSASSPPTVLRHFLLAHYSLEALAALADSLDVDYQQMAHGNKSELARNLLLYLQRRNQLDRLIPRLHEQALATKED